MLGKGLRPVIVISAVNIVDGGALSALKDCLAGLDQSFSGNYRIVALVHKADLFSFENIEYIEFEKSKRSWAFRVFYEYFYFKRLSLRLRPYLWLSMHDTTPNVLANIRAVYCHNPAPFYKLNSTEVLYEPKLYIFNLFYRYLYKININQNTYVVVQQQWLREEFKKMVQGPKIVVAHPKTEQLKSVQLQEQAEIKKDAKKVSFFYPAFPRVFKNYEVICKAAEYLHNKGISGIEIFLTIDGTENKYSKKIVDQFKGIPSLIFTGIISREEVLSLYTQIDCMVFPSKLETWGMPLSEFKLYEKPILVSDLHYAKETVGNYQKVKFFNPEDYVQLAEFIEHVLNGTLTYDGNSHQKVDEDYFAKDWKDLFKILLAK